MNVLVGAVPPLCADERQTMLDAVPRLQPPLSPVRSLGETGEVPDGARARQWRLRKRRVSLLLAAMLMPVWACGGNSDAQEVQRYEGGVFSLEVPTDWRAEHKEAAGAGRGVLFLSPDLVRNARALPNEVFVFRPERPYERWRTTWPTNTTSG